MTRQTREMLKKKFKAGNMPSEGDFADLIESMLNLLDEGFDKTAKDGFKLAQVSDGKLLSFFKDIEVGNALWMLGLEKGSENRLSFQDQAQLPVLTLASGQNLDGSRQCAVGINQPLPRQQLDVGGIVASYGWIGKNGKFAVPADGNWYDITETLSGCHAMEVFAGVGGKDADGKYALTHALALNTFNGNSSITHHHAHFGNRCSRIELRWAKSDSDRPFEYKLQMRVGCSYGEDVWVKYHITQRWLDTMMQESEVRPDEPPRPLPPAKRKR